MAIGLSFTQVAAVIGQTKAVLDLSKLGGLTDVKVAHYARIIACVNFDYLRIILGSAWAFSITFDGATHQNIGYLYIRLRLELGGQIYDVHVMAVPMDEKHSGLNMYDHVKKVFDVLCPDWKKN